MRRQVIVTADDFGLALPVNEAVEIAHREGILGGASLMVAEPAANDAVARARRLPTLRIGLHVVVADGHPALPPDMIPDLVTADGRFDDRLVHAGIRFFCLPHVRRQLHAEIRAQFAAFQATGLALDHVNAHKHMHLHPTILGMILRIGREYGLQAMRLPHEPWRSGRSLSRTGLIGQIGRSVLMTPWLALLRWRLQRAGICFNQFVFGLNTTGMMTEDAVLRILHCLPAGVSEIYFHPATLNHPSTALPMEAARHDAELRALISPRVRRAVKAADLDLISFSDLH